MKFREVFFFICVFTFLKIDAQNYVPHNQHLGRMVLVSKPLFNNRYIQFTKWPQNVIQPFNKVYIAVGPIPLVRQARGLKLKRHYNAQIPKLGSALLKGHQRIYYGNEKKDYAPDDKKIILNTTPRANFNDINYKDSTSTISDEKFTHIKKKGFMSPENSPYYCRSKNSLHQHKSQLQRVLTTNLPKVQYITTYTPLKKYVPSSSTTKENLTPTLPFLTSTSYPFQEVVNNSVIRTDTIIFATPTSISFKNNDSFTEHSIFSETTASQALDEKVLDSYYRHTTPSVNKPTITTSMVTYLSNVTYPTRQINSQIVKSIHPHEKLAKNVYPKQRLHVRPTEAKQLRTTKKKHFISNFKLPKTNATASDQRIKQNNYNNSTSTASSITQSPKETPKPRKNYTNSYRLSKINVVSKTKNLDERNNEKVRKDQEQNKRKKLTNYNTFTHKGLKAENFTIRNNSILSKSTQSTIMKIIRNNSLSSNDNNLKKLRFADDFPKKQTTVMEQNVNMPSLPIEVYFKTQTKRT